MTKLYGADSATVTELGSIYNGIGADVVPIEGTIPIVGSQVQLTYTPVLLAPSFVDQIPSGLGVPLNITYGAAQSNAYIDLAATGEVTFLQSGLYLLEIRAAVGRASNPGTAILMARSLLNGTQLGNSLHALLPNQDSQQPLYASLRLSVNANDVFVTEIVRDAAGADFGGLYTEPASTAGWNNSPSAQITISRVTAAIV